MKSLPKPLPVEILPATADHAFGIAALTNHAITTSVVHFGTKPITPGQIVDRWQNRGNHPWLVALSDPQDPATVVGYARSYPWKSRGAYQWTCEIGVYVHADWHRRGVGRALYAALFPALETAGFRTILAAITLPNDASKALHEFFGMTRCAVFEQAGFKHGTWHDVAYWIKHLGDRSQPPE